MNNNGLSTRLPKAVEVFKPEEQNKIVAALRLVESICADRKLDDGSPYVEHPLAVARILLEEIDLKQTGVRPLDAVCAAILHGILENSTLTADDIKKWFGPEVARIVSSLTRVHDQSVPQEVWEVAYMTRLMTTDKVVRLVKIADRLQNMRLLHLAPPEKRRSYWQETAEWYLPLAEITERKLYESLLDLCSWHRRDMGIIYEDERTDREESPDDRAG